MTTIVYKILFCFLFLLTTPNIKSSHILVDKHFIFLEKCLLSLSNFSLLMLNLELSENFEKVVLKQYKCLLFCESLLLYFFG